jgi:hypothetical protein
MFAVAIILAILCLALMGVVLWLILRKPQANTDSTLLLKAEMTEINKSMAALKDGVQQQLTDQLGTSNKQM